jgi:hypothetical protein
MLHAWTVIHGPACMTCPACMLMQQLLLLRACVRAWIVRARLIEHHLQSD